MTLYLVKWSDGSSALITAEDEDHLVLLLDQLDDPGEASWIEYDGPLWLEFPAPTEGLPEGDVNPYEIPWLSGAPAETDWGLDFVEAVRTKLHPELDKLCRAAQQAEHLILRPDFEQAAEADLVWGLPGSIFGSSDGTVN